MYIYISTYEFPDVGLLGIQAGSFTVFRTAGKRLEASRLQASHGHAALGIQASGIRALV